MPAKRPQATFEPISPALDVRDLVESTDNFQYVDRISCEMIEQQGIDAFEKLVLLHVIIGGKPLVVDGFEDLLDPWTFTPRWLLDNHGTKVEKARNLTTRGDIPLTIGHYLRNMGPLTDQFFQKPTNYKDKNRQRMYLKDIDCPPVWQDKLREQVPAALFYLNESTGEVGGLGSVDDSTAGATGGRKGRGFGRAGDLMSSLPPEMRAENLMCYIGHEGTYTPSHKEMCASLGQNIMVEASTSVGEDGRPEKPGSSLWFMTETKDRHTVQEYWLSILGHDVEVENHFAQIMAWVAAPFKTYVVEQRPGDFILIPPLAPHQVWNRGTRTMKVAWNRTTVETLEMAMNEALPNARMVCRDEQYKNKAIIYYTLAKYATILTNVRTMCEAQPDNAYKYMRNTKVRQIQKDFKKLFDLFKNILLGEMFSTDAPKEHPEFLTFESNVTCAYCRGNIFNRFLTCKTCPRALGTDVDEPYDVCMECFVMGRSCACTSDLKWCEQWRWKDLLYKYEAWRRIIISIDGAMTEKTPQPFPEERRYYGKKTLAQICQEQLRIRPWVDIQNPKPPDEEDEEAEILVNEDGTVKKINKKLSKTFQNNNPTCHVCLHRHPKWKQAKCTFCESWWCYGTLYRAHDLMPQTVMQDLHWKCPHCRKVCNTGRCRVDPRQRPFEPKGTLLGHDTRKVADVRSVDALFSYGVSNLNWINENGDPRDSARLQALQAAAERAKQQDLSLDDHFEDEHGIRFSPVHDTQQGPINDTMIDPELGGSGNEPRPQAPANPADDAIDGDHELDNGDDFQPYAGPTGTSKSRKRRSENQIQIVTTTPKKRRKVDGEDPPPSATGVSGATKQFRKEQEKKLLADAREANRYIIVWGRMKSKSRIVRLNMDPDKLEEILARPSAGSMQDRQHTAGARGPILQSDITKASPQTNTTTSNAAKAKLVLEKVRGEKDDDFRMGRKRRDDGSSAHQKKASARTYEDVDTASDDEYAEYAPPTANRRALRDEDLVELPDDFKDGTVNPRSSRRSTTGGGAQIRLPPRVNGKFARASLPSKAELEAQAQAAREAAARMDEENRKAKMMAASWAEGGEPIPISDAEEPSSDDEDLLDAPAAQLLTENNESAATRPSVQSTGFTPVNAAKTADIQNPPIPSSPVAEFSPPPPPLVRKSIFEKNKNVRIVGAKNGEVRKPPPRKRDIEESDSEDEIPAVVTKSKGRGRPSKVQ